MNTQKTRDLICLGRASVDLYAQQIGSRLEDVSSFAKYLGGCATNIAFGAARLGLKSALLTRVGDEHMGRFIREELRRAGVDVSHVHTDKRRLTALVVLGIESREDFPLIFFRRDCADMALCETDFDEAFIASARSLLLTGTHLSTDSTYRASKTALEYARANGVKVVLDIDYRPVLWGLTGIGEGQNRYVEHTGVTARLHTLLALCDLIVGTEEEINIAGGHGDIIASLKAIRAASDALIVLKLGALGCAVLPGDIPDSMAQIEPFCGVEVEVLNVLGAGDAFMSGFLRGWINGEPLERCCAYANACGALVVSRHGCAPAIPSQRELDDYLARAERVARPDRDTRLNYLHRLAGRNPACWHDLCVLAFDHRSQFLAMARQAGADAQRITAFKRLIAAAFGEVQAEIQATNADTDTAIHTGLLIDDHYGQELLNEFTGSGAWIGRPVEVPASRPLEFEGEVSIGQKLATWPREQVVKCLVHYHPDDPAELRLQQERKMRELYDACAYFGLELLLEIIPPVEDAEEAVLRAVQRCYHLGLYPDWWKLPAPDKAAWPQIAQQIEDHAPECRGVLLLGLNGSPEQLADDFVTAATFPICKGFAVGRTVFAEPARLWFGGRLSDRDAVRTIGQNYLGLIRAWQTSRAG